MIASGRVGDNISELHCNHKRIQWQEIMTLEVQKIPPVIVNKSLFLNYDAWLHTKIKIKIARNSFCEVNVL